MFWRLGSPGNGGKWSGGFICNPSLSLAVLNTWQINSPLFRGGVCGAVLDRLMAEIKSHRKWMDVQRWAWIYFSDIVMFNFLGPSLVQSARPLLILGSCIVCTPVLDGRHQVEAVTSLKMFHLEFGCSWWESQLKLNETLIWPNM